MKNLTPALFLDRDGVINREVEYLYKSEQVQFIPGIFDLCRAAQALEHKVIVITNQSGIARQFYSEEDFHALMRWMTEEFAREQVILDAYYYCPHHPQFGVGQYRLDCPDRKPGPGMLFRAAQEHRIDLGKSLLLGDRCSDIEAGAAAGVGKLVLLAGTEPSSCISPARYVVVPSIMDAINLLPRNVSPPKATGNI